MHTIPILAKTRAGDFIFHILRTKGHAVMVIDPKAVSPFNGPHSMLIMIEIVSPILACYIFLISHHGHTVRGIRNGLKYLLTLCRIPIEFTHVRLDLPVVFIRLPIPADAIIFLLIVFGAAAIDLCLSL